ncbi:Low molecular weight phosphotyrosine protein phosphatase [Coniosporium tulheliwenetii]|uniref:Low molecular weight phosphotyrosine protein phosphatase n=1 Tax=Coniosporium tulheliwenetii TaxID=3383036 RepID=A0ACC2Z813_9PEZI|nr:Low molecular weight phosphotyrosine protein phosphatase [Cladosporium sp. JES 115]
MAEGVFRHLLTSSPSHPPITRIDSCGTGAYHIGDPPDPRTMSVLEDHGITSYRHRARKLSRKDFDEFEWIMAMDEDNLDYLSRMRRKIVENKGMSEEEAERLGKVGLWGDFGGNPGEEVVDPYYGARDGFSIAYEQMVRFSRGFLRFLEERGSRGRWMS